LFLFFFLICQGMDAQLVFDMIPPRQKIPHFRRIAFNKLVVFDNRLDTSNIKEGLNNLGQPVVWKFDTSAAIGITRYMDLVCKQSQNENRTLFVSIKQLRYQNRDPLQLYFWADAYFASGNGYVKVASVKKFCSNNIVYGSNNFKRRIDQALNDLIQRASNGAQQKAGADTTLYTADDINHCVTREWAGYPVMENTIGGGAGIYRSIGDLRNNRADTVDLSMVMESDSAYIISFKDEIARKKWEGNYNIFAVRWNGTLYINVNRLYFLPLTKTGETLSLRVPSSLPNLAAILASEHLASMDSSPAVQPDNLAALVLAILLQSYLGGKSAQQYDRAKQAFLARGIASDQYRTGVVDMDTGDLVVALGK
jgi:hypothetical protein